MARSKLGEWFFGENRPSVPDASAESTQQGGSVYAGERDIAAQPPHEPAPTPAGWHQVDGTLRYHDGSDWTGHVAPPYPASLSTGGIAGAVMIGVLAALFLVWLGSQISPEHIYLPVKFVVKELPAGFR
jgi:Protein of unknown function (DUF2510)